MATNASQGILPFFTIVSNNFEKDIEMIKRMFSAFETMSCTEHGFMLSDRAEMAAGGWFYDIFINQEFATKLFQTIIPEGVRDKKSATIRIIDLLQEQLRKYGSEAKIKMHGDTSFAAPWWAWLMR
jgi:hypothetical protein